MTEELVRYETQSSGALMPAMEIGSALQRYDEMKTFIQQVLHKGTDYGRVPGTSKDTLLKPGAEKLTTFFGLSVRFTELETVQDWTGTDHGDEPFFSYRHRCHLYRGDLLVAEADGGCNSWEAKYRYRKQGGQRVKNEQIFDQVNTLVKMSEKRALIAATLIAVNASEYFTQDLEDMDYSIIDAEIVPHQAQKHNPAPKPANDHKAAQPAGVRSVEQLVSHLQELMEAYKGKPEPSEKQARFALSSLQKLTGNNDDARHIVTRYLFGVDSTGDLTGPQCSAIVDWVGCTADNGWKPLQSAVAEARLVYKAAAEQPASSLTEADFTDDDDVVSEGTAESMPMF